MPVALNSATADPAASNSEADVPAHFNMTEEEFYLEEIPLGSRSLK
jgi:hypothetical protein